jgi:hypothetical protein
MKFYQVEVESMGELLKVLALVVSGRKKGNCYDFAHFVLEYLENREIETEIDNSVVSTVVLASPHVSLSTEWTPCIMADEIKHMGRIIAVFEVINTAGFGSEPLFNSLLEEEEIQRRLTFLAERTLTIARERCNDG